MSYGKILGLLLLMGVGQAFSLERVKLSPLVAHDGAGHFKVDDNFKFHHQALVDCVDFACMRDLARGLEHPEWLQEPAYVKFGQGAGVYDTWRPLYVRRPIYLSNGEWHWKHIMYCKNWLGLPG